MTPRKSRVKTKGVFMLLILGIFFPANGACQTPPQKKLQVVILAVTHFDDKSWDNAQLQLGTEKSVNDLRRFFNRRFPNAEVHLLSSRDQTTHESIETFLRGEFHQFGNGTVTLFFVLSHGVPNRSSNPNFSQDLLIVTSDTSKNNPQARALSVAKDLVPEFVGLELPGSIVLAFLDTCYSGAATSLNMRVLNVISENYGLRTMVMASSLSEAQSYRAFFSEALLEMWNVKSSGSPCTTPELAPEKLRKSIRAKLREQKPPVELGPIEGLPKVVIPYRGKLCLESFAADNGLFVFLNGSSSAVAATIKSNGQPIDDSFPLPLESNDVVPYKALRDRYTVEVERADGTQLFEHSADLRTEPVTFEVIGPANATQLGAGFLRTAEYVDFARLPKEESIGYQKRAFATFASGGIESRALDVATRLRELQPEDKDIHIAQELAFRSVVVRPSGGHAFISLLALNRARPWILYASVFFMLSSLALSIVRHQYPQFRDVLIRPVQRWTFAIAIALVLLFGLDYVLWHVTAAVPVDEVKLEKEYGPGSLARLEKLAGRFDKAAELYAKAASLPSNGSEFQRLSAQAYFAYGASGQPEKAQKLRTGNRLFALEQDCPVCIEKEQAALRENGQGIATGEFSSLCKVQALSKLDF